MSKVISLSLIGALTGLTLSNCKLKPQIEDIKQQNLGTGNDFKVIQVPAPSGNFFKIVPQAISPDDIRIEYKICQNSPECQTELSEKKFHYLLNAPLGTFTVQMRRCTEKSCGEWGPETSLTQDRFSSEISNIRREVENVNQSLRNDIDRHSETMRECFEDHDYEAFRYEMENFSEISTGFLQTQLILTSKVMHRIAHLEIESYFVDENMVPSLKNKMNQLISEISQRGESIPPVSLPDQYVYL